jgi:hypothetical protein
MYRKLGSVVLVLALCTTGAASALSLEPEAAGAPQGTASGLWERLLDWISRIVVGDDDVAPVWLDTCHIDPNGICGPH